MIVLGISGFENAMPFKRAHWTSLEEREYRMVQGHDAAAACVVDGKIVAAAAEERFTRRKHSADFPINAIEYCLATAGIALNQVDELAHAFDYSPYRAIYSLDPLTAEQYNSVFSRETLLTSLRRAFPGFPADRLVHVNHHLAHAASAYYTSGWDECLLAVIDGMGEAHSATVYRARQGSFEKLLEISANDSIGILYSLVTLHLGFDFNSDEYKIMGLAPYGDPALSFFLRSGRDAPGGRTNPDPAVAHESRPGRSRNLRCHAPLPGRAPGPSARPGDDVTDAHRDVAAALQECLDQAILHICRQAGEATGLRRLALAGGVALNCTSNGKLLSSGQFDDIYVQPAAGDDGSALGAALSRLRTSAPCGMCAWRRLSWPSGCRRRDRSRSREILGPCRPVRLPSTEAACIEAARLIQQGNVIAWYRGRMEFGPRALGNRSILADPGHPEMRNRINAMVKLREAFRPFAPAVTQEQVHQWFDVPARRGAEIHDRDRRRAPRASAVVARRHARQRHGSSANCVVAGQCRLSSTFGRGGQANRAPNGFEHQLQCQRPTNRQHADGSNRDVFDDGDRWPVPGQHFGASQTGVPRILACWIGCRQRALIRVNI